MNLLASYIVVNKFGLETFNLLALLSQIGIRGRASAMGLRLNSRAGTASWVDTGRSVGGR